MARYSLQEFIDQTSQKDKGEGLFEVESDHMIEVNLDGLMWAKVGAMCAYEGDIKFVREGMMEHGFEKFLKKALTGEGAHLMKAQGKGKLYLADNGKRISILNLQNESIFVNGNDLLAFEPSITWDIKFMRKVSSMLSGGLFNIKLEGSGMVAITTYYEPLTIRVTPNKPVCTDPNATVAWSGSLYPELKTDLSFRSLIRSTGEAFQMEFKGDGFVVIQPYEEVYFQAGSGSMH